MTVSTILRIDFPAANRILKRREKTVFFCFFPVFFSFLVMFWVEHNIILSSASIYKLCNAKQADNLFHFHFVTNS